MIMTKYLITRKEENNLIFVEIYEYNGYSSDKMSKIIEQYWINKPTAINRNKYYIARIFKICNGPKIRMI